MSSFVARLFLQRPAVLRIATHQTFSKTASAFPRCMVETFRHCRGINTCLSLLRAEEKVTIHILNRDGKRLSVKASTGDTLLDVVNHNLDIDGFGACEGTLACSTCHLIFEEAVYKKLGPVSDEEMDMLDLAYGLTDTSRLGCQVCLMKDLDGMIMRVPEAVSDARVDSENESSAPPKAQPIK